MLGFFEDHSVLLNRNSTPTKLGHSGLRWTHFGMFLFSSSHIAKPQTFAGNAKLFR